MASVKVAVRCRPLNGRELDLESDCIVSMDKKVTRLLKEKVTGSPLGLSVANSSRSSVEGSTNDVREFSFDYCYHSDPAQSRDPDRQPANQDQVFQDLGRDVVASAFEGFNGCIFAYGQTGSGKTYSMMGTEEEPGLTPRICKSLFEGQYEEGVTYRTEVSYMEIYNERVRDLMKPANKHGKLRVREHPKDGPYVEDLTRYTVHKFEDIARIMGKGNAHRMTASTLMNDTSSRSHAIFTIVFTQAKLSKDCPEEKYSKIHLVDLAGNERVQATGATGDRLKEGASINKSLVLLGKVVSTLAEQSSSKRTLFVPYRDSVLTWLLKDSLGGNSKTLMIATISPASVNYFETLSTLRYASRAQRIVNKPTVNEDPNVRLIRDLRAEIMQLRALLEGQEVPVGPTERPGSEGNGPRKVQMQLQESEERVALLTEEWAGKWRVAGDHVTPPGALGLRRHGPSGVVVDSDLPYLVGIDDDILATGIQLYHLKEGLTRVGSDQGQDIVLTGSDIEAEHCVIECQVTSPIGSGSGSSGDEDYRTPISLRLSVCPGTAAVQVNSLPITREDGPVRLDQGSLLQLGQRLFRFNHPAQAEAMRRRRSCVPDVEVGTSGLRSLSTSRMSLMSLSMSDLTRSSENLAVLAELEARRKEEAEKLEAKRFELAELETKFASTEQEWQTEQARREAELEEKRRELELLQETLKQERAEVAKQSREFRGRRSKDSSFAMSKSLSSECLQQPRRHSTAEGRSAHLESERQYLTKKWQEEEDDLVDRMTLLENFIHAPQDVDPPRSLIDSLTDRADGLSGDLQALIDASKAKLAELRSEHASRRVQHASQLENLDEHLLESNRRALGGLSCSTLGLPSRGKLGHFASGSQERPEDEENRSADPVEGLDLSEAPLPYPPSPKLLTCNLKLEHLATQVLLDEGQLGEDELRLAAEEAQLESARFQVSQLERQYRLDTTVQERLLQRYVDRKRRRLVTGAGSSVSQGTSPQHRRVSHVGISTSLLSSTSCCHSAHMQEDSRMSSCPAIDPSNRDLTAPLDQQGNFQVEIPQFMMHGRGRETHIQYEVKISIGVDKWTLYRRYSRFYDLHSVMKRRYPEVENLFFPRKRIMIGRYESIARGRQHQLEGYLRNLCMVLFRRHTSRDVPTASRDISTVSTTAPHGMSREVLYAAHNFFKPGNFDTTKFETC